MKNKKILIVEDESLIALELKMTLQAKGIQQIYIASTGQKAIEIAIKNHPDLILMDILLKGDMDGIDAAKNIRMKHNIPIVYMSGNSHLKSDPRLIKSHPYAFLEKPIPLSKLFTVIEEILGNSNPIHS